MSIARTNRPARVSPRLLALTALVASAAGGCVDDGSLDEDLELTEAAEFSRPPLPAFTTVTLYSEAGLWGTSQTVTLYPDNRAATAIDPAPGPVRQNKAVQSSLRGSVSSARIVCGTSATDVIFYDADANGAPGAAVSCRPGATVNTNFHTTQGYPGGVLLGDRIDGLNAWLRPDVANEYPLSQAVRSIWSDVHGQVVTSADWYAPRAKEAYVYVYDANTFLVGQEYTTFNDTREAPITIHIYVHVMNDASGFRFQTELHYFTCTRATGSSSGISCGARVDQQRNQLVQQLQGRLNTLANALPHTRHGYLYPTLGAIEFGVGFVP